MDVNKLRTVLLQVVNECSRVPNTFLESGWILQEVRKRLQIGDGINDQKALLSHYHDLFRIGYLAWGHNLANPNPPFCHVTEQGETALSNLSRDPANPNGYLQFLNSRVLLDPIACSYISEALSTYNSGSYKASAVMVGVATESIVLQLRDLLIDTLDKSAQPKSSKLSDWKIKVVLDAIEDVLKRKQQKMPKGLYERFESYWSAFTQQIRTVRNEAGHPISIEPVSQEIVHASLLIFPELAVLSKDLCDWIATGFE